MKLRAISIEQEQALAAAVWAAELSSETALSDMLRAEVTARGQCRRACAIGRVIQTLLPLAEVDKETVSEVCALLEREGDFSVANGGVLHATPLRMVEVEPTVWRVVSSVPTRQLREWFPGSVRSIDCHRQLVFHASETETNMATIKANGGICLSAETWAGLAHVPVADQRWLDGLETRREWCAKPAGSLESDGELDWHGLSITKDGVKWRRQPENPAKLWRARTPWGYWKWAWTGSEESPRQADFVPLYTADGNRTIFALARVSNTPMRMHVEREEQQTIIGIRPWLPRSEYRYLSMKGTPLQREDGMSQWTLPAKGTEEVVELLAERLGLREEAS